MIYLRSFLFNIYFMVMTAVVIVGCSPFLLGSRYRAHTGGRMWLRGTRWGTKHILGLDDKIIGQERLPKGPYIIACKHQSVWETVVLGPLFPNATVVIKKELLKIPFMNLYYRRLNSIPVDRNEGLSALKLLISRAKEEIAKGRDIFIFPEGTRVAPDEESTLQPGIAALYQQLNIPVVPVALNAGAFWGRRSFLKYPGTITLEILPAIEPGLDRKQFTSTLQRVLNERSRELYLEAMKGRNNA